MIYEYRKAEQGEFILIGADPGEGHDNSTFVALSKWKRDIVMVGQSKEESSQLGYTLNSVGKHFEQVTGIYPCIAPERNIGASTLFVLKLLNYPNIFKMPDSFTKTTDVQTENYGWLTSSATRPKMLDDLALAIRQQAIGIPSKLVIEEMFSFIRNKRTGKPESEVGTHDDLVMATAIAWQLYQIVPRPDDFDASEIPDDTKKFEGWY